MTMTMTMTTTTTTMTMTGSTTRSGGMTMTDDDLVKRLLVGACAQNDVAWSLMREAADRIKALTAEHNATLARLAGAVAREIALTAERDNALNHLDSERYSVEVLEKRVAKFMADNARLREALNQSRLAFAGYVSVQSAMDLIDRAALTGKDAK